MAGVQTCALPIWFLRDDTTYLVSGGAGANPRRIVRGADDLFQETWLRAAANIRRYDPTRSPDRSFDHWLFSIAHNLAIDHLRRRKPESLPDSLNAAPMFAGNKLALDQLLDSERADALARAITELPAPYREVLALRFEEDMKLEQIARVTGAPLPTVKSRLQRALQSLRKRFE